MVASRLIFEILAGKCHFYSRKRHSAAEKFIFTKQPSSYMKVNLSLVTQTSGLAFKSEAVLCETESFGSDFTRVDSCTSSSRNGCLQKLKYSRPFDNGALMTVDNSYDLDLTKSC